MSDQLPAAGSTHLVRGRLCLDFANAADWHPADSPEEVRHTYADLVAWALHASALTQQDGERARQRAEAHPAEARDALQRAHALREAIYRTFTAVAQGSPLPRADLALLNAALAAALPHRCLACEGEDCVWRWEDPGDALDAMLWPVALAAAMLLTGPARARVGVCADEQCDWLFLDTSKSGRRRWCSMEGCGNRAKARRHYQRQRAASPH
jgi:predicted RNA-binding Zn ribbon-like protein